MGTHQDIRIRTVQWRDPAECLTQALGMTGLDQVWAILAGRLPAPAIGKTGGFYGVKADTGRVVLAAQGGLPSNLLDTAMWLAIHSTMPAGAYESTLLINMSYLRPIVVGGAVTAQGRVLHRGRSVVTARGDLRNRAGKVCAHATTSCSVVTYQGGTMPGPGSNIASKVVPLRAVDEVSAEQSESGWRIRARKVIDGSDRDLDGQFPGTAVYPGVFIVESLLEAVSQGLGVACEVGSVRSARFLLPLMSGDAMLLDATVEPTTGGMFLVAATVLCENVGVAAKLDVLLCRQEIADVA